MSVSRREFLKSTAAATVASTLGIKLALPAPAAGQSDVEKWVKGTCRYCGVGCRIYIGVKNGKAVAVKGVPDAKTNYGFICMKAFLQYKIYHHPDRIKYPLLRKGNKFVRISWDKALDLMAKKFANAIKKYGPDSVGYYGSGQALTEETYLAQKIFRAGIGTSNVDGNPRLCMASAVGGYLTTYGADEPSGSYSDIEHATCFFLIGTNQSEAHPIIFRRVMTRKLENPDKVKVIVADPRITPTSRIADLHLQFLPGTDLAVMHAMAQVIIEEELYDKHFVENFVAFKTVGPDGKPRNMTFEEYKQFLQDFTPEKAEQISKCPADKIRQAARWFAKADATFSMWTMGLNQRTRGVWANNLVHNLHLLTGQIGKIGADAFSLTGQPNACGGVREAGGLCHILPGHRKVANPKHREEIAKIWNIPVERLPKKPGYHTVEMFRALADGRLKALIVLCTNPAQSLPNVGPVRKGFERKDNFVVVFEAYPSRTAELADLVLPAPILFEKEGVYGCSERRSQYTFKGLEPPGEAKPEVWALREFALRLSKELKDPVIAQIVEHLKSTEDIWNEYRKCTVGRDMDLWGAPYERLKKLPDGLQWPVPSVDHPGTVKRFVKGMDILAKGPEPIQFYGHPDKRAWVWARPYKGPAEAPDAEYPFYLTTIRVIEHWHTMTMTGRVPELMRGFSYTYVEINPKDAKKLGIRNGDMVEIASRRGKVVVPAKVVEGPIEGVVAVPFHDQDLQRMINFVTIDAFDAGSKQPEFKICAVKIRKVSGPKRVKPTIVGLEVV